MAKCTYADFSKAKLTPSFMNFSETVLLDIFSANKNTWSILKRKLEALGAHIASKKGEKLPRTSHAGLRYLGAPSQSDRQSAEHSDPEEDDLATDQPDCDADIDDAFIDLDDFMNGEELTPNIYGNFDGTEVDMNSVEDDAGLDSINGSIDTDTSEGNVDLETFEGEVDLSLAQKAAPSTYGNHVINWKQGSKIARRQKTSL
ncbi:hypothetical protein BGZ65_010178 [Modicella reniformis]|uniref:Uncharacterized protein n=1 Tax=Modicella reniformis TaxID=1440133 RepID=A0A9P6ME46_9FUNG|nr:hypothetical protein BGZ65_010178 [Modicella reniformis]